MQIVVDNQRVSNGELSLKIVDIQRTIVLPHAEHLAKPNAGHRLDNLTLQYKMPAIVSVLDGVQRRVIASERCSMLDCSVASRCIRVCSSREVLILAFTRFSRG